jgi:hypothetical protein
VGVVSAVAALTAACAAGPVVKTGDAFTRPQPATPTSSVPTPANNLHLANAYDYFARSDDHTGYYFTTPSGRWRCAIVTHTRAGCESAGGSSMGIPGSPATVVDTDGASHTPNAIVVDELGDAHFAWVGQAEFSSVSGSGKVLEFNRVLDAAGFRCNVQQSGVSCLNESTGNGFTFSSDGYTLQYTDVPDDAPP